MAGLISDGVNPNIAERMTRFLEQTEGDGGTPPAVTDTATDQKARAESETAAPPAAAEEEQAAEGAAAEGATTAPESDEETIDTLSDLAKVFEVDENEFVEHLQVSTADGAKVSLKTVLDAYAQGPASNETVRAEVEKQTVERQKALDGQIDALTKATAQVLARMDARKTNIDWEKLKQENPAGYIALLEEHEADRREAAAALERLEAQQKVAEAEREKQHKAFVEEESRKVLRLMPEWRDPEKAKQASAEIRGYLREKGMSDDQIDGISDAISLTTVWEAAQYRKTQAKKPESLKRLRGVPTRKALAATARRDTTPNEARQKQRAAQFDRLRRSGDVRDAAVLMREHLD